MYESRTIPPQNEVDRTGENPAKGLNLSELRPSVREAVSSLPVLPRRPNGIFRHPPDWTQEEMDLIADALKMNVPISTIAKMVHCERNALSRLIHKTPELLQLKEEQQENLYEEAIYQADRLAKAGNASIVMFILERLGKKKGWTQAEQPSEESKDEGRIVMGIIPDDELEKAKEYVEEKQKEVMPKSVVSEMTDPVKKAVMDEEVERRAEELAAEKIAEGSIEVEGEVGPSPYEGGDGYGSFGEMGGYGGYGYHSDSMFMQ